MSRTRRVLRVFVTLADAYGLVFFWRATFFFAYVSAPDENDRIVRVTRSSSRVMRARYLIAFTSRFDAYIRCLVASNSVRPFDRYTTQYETRSIRSHCLRIKTYTSLRAGTIHGPIEPPFVFQTAYGQRAQTLFVSPIAVA